MVAAPDAVAQPVDGRLPRTVVPLRYHVRLAVDPAVDTFTGSVDIVVRANAPTDTVWLNARALDVQSAKAVVAGASEDATVAKVDDDVISVKLARPLPAGEATLTLAWRGTIDGRGAVGLFRQQDNDRWYAMTQFEPMDAPMWD